jgi:peptidoglycan/xylan/chitin deacetylase (PgdA/CDA1 family)
MNRWEFLKICAAMIGTAAAGCTLISRDRGAATSGVSPAAGRPGLAKMPASWIWPQHALAAVSLTYDDGNPSQLDQTIPDLGAAGFRGTFYLHIARRDMQARVVEWQAAHQRGHEMGNHTVRHAGRGAPYIKRDGRLPDWMPLPLERFTPQMIADEVTAAAEWLDKHIGPDPDRTFAYPCGAVAIGDPPDEKSYDAAVLRHHFAARVGGDSHCARVNDPRTMNLLRIASFDGRGTDPAPLIAPCDEALAVGGWTVLGFHTTERPAHPALLAHLRAGPFWVAPVKTVARYVQANQHQEKEP